MASLNKVMLIGNLTRDPEVKYTPKGTAVAELAIAVNRSFIAENGEKRDEVTYVDITFWAKSAEAAGQYLKKGRPIFVEGRLQLDQWEDKASGQKRSRLRVVGENFQFLDRREGGEGNSGGDEGGSARSFQRPAQRPAASRPSQPASDSFNEGPITEGMEDDNIPF
ncbi:MAG: single-stranded DNA-binding protein [Verrucomicrobia bacterium]|nr:single-stranded DNA-binding protein [Verrucomicrobiota bacterium]